MRRSYVRRHPDSIWTRVLKRLRTWGWRDDEIADVLGCSRELVYYHLGARLPQHVRTKRRIFVGRVMSRLFGPDFRWGLQAIGAAWGFSGPYVCMLIREARYENPRAA